MPARFTDSAKQAIVAVLVIGGVLVFLFIFHFILGMTWMIYVLVIAVFSLILIRKMVALKKQKARSTASTS